MKYDLVSTNIINWSDAENTCAKKPGIIVGNI